MFKTLFDFLNSLPNWFQTIATNRTTQGDAQGRPWFAQSVGYKNNLLLEQLQTITDTTDLNQQVIDRLAVTDVNSKQGVAALRIQIAQLYSFKKCFVARHKTRLQYYRDDLTQKAYRNLYAVQLSYDNYANLETNLNAQNSQS